ncbi:hypothetical protein AB0K09_24600 [Streptomyces sp. NPDC049577]|uniref:hypothetical protein n=1 Tax=Streptomyces sp. NPDC049577 TaxID=3155153 RepID=UPI0034258029
MALVTHLGAADTTSAQEPLLSFEITTSPDPLKASPENPSAPLEKGELIIVGSRRHRDPADVESIRVKVPAGTMSPDLATDLGQVNHRISLPGWTSRLDTTRQEFVFEPTAGYATIDANTGFTIQLSQIPISRKVGASPIDVTERSRTGNSAFQPRTTQFSVGKFPPDFYLRNLICNPLVIDNGGQVTLTWERSANAEYQLLYGATCLDVTNETRRIITDVRSDTTFYLIGTVSTGAETVKRILSTGVTVIKPDLEIGNLTVHGTVTAKDNISIAAGKKLVTPEISAAGSSIKISSSVDHTTGTVKLLAGGGLEVNGLLAAKGGIQGNAGAPLVVHQNDGLEVHGKFQAGTRGNAECTAVFKKPVTVENTLSVSAGNALKTNKITTVSGGTITVDKHIDMAKGTVLRTGDLRGVNDGADKTIKVSAPIDFTAGVDIVKEAKRGKLTKNAQHSFTADTSGLLVIHAWAGNSGSTAGTEVYVNTFPHGRFMTYADHSNGQPGGELLTIPLKRNDQVQFKVVNRRGNIGDRPGWWMWLPFGATNVGNGPMAAAELVEPAETAVPTGPVEGAEETAAEEAVES